MVDQSGGDVTPFAGGRGRFSGPSRPAQKLLEVSASCAHLETKRTVFHRFVESMSSPFPVETKRTVFHCFVVASWKLQGGQLTADLWPVRAARGACRVQRPSPGQNRKRGR